MYLSWYLVECGANIQHRSNSILLSLHLTPQSDPPIQRLVNNPYPHHFIPYKLLQEVFIYVSSIP